MFKVGDKVKCLIYVSRRDKGSHLNPGDVVTVTQEYIFDYKGEKCQDITVQKGRDMPIAVLAKPGRFEKVEE